LQGIGGAALAVPFLSSLHRPAKAQEVVAPRRLVIFYTNNGCLTNRWFPKVENGAITEESLAGTTLSGLAPFASKLLFPRGLAMFPRGFDLEVNGVVYFDPHDQGMGSKLTCAPIDPTDGSDHWALSHSLDHEVAKLVNPGTKSPLVLSVGAFFNPGVKQILSYSAAQEPYAPETNPGNVYKTLTGLFPATGDGEADYRIKRGQSIIDLVSEDLNGFKKLNMSQADQKRVQDWLDLLRETEQQVVPATCNAETAAALGITDSAVSEATGNGFDMATAFTLGGDMMIKLIALSMMCDSNRSILLHWPGYVKFQWDGLSHQYDHHGLSHRNGSADVGGTCVSGVMDRIAEIDNWYAGRYVKLVSLLDSVTEGDGTLLDHSACMWLPELADGNAHNQDNLPIVIAGSAGGYLKQGQSVNLTSKSLGTGNSEASCTTGADGEENSLNTGSGFNIQSVPLNKLYVTLINAVGGAVSDFTPVDSFGTWDTNDGPGITNPGELTALKA
jgi:hypothetical protein